MQERIEKELDRIRHGTQATPPDGLGIVRFTVITDGTDPSQLLGKVRSVLEIIDEVGVERWPTAGEWSAILPQWFVAACAPEMSREEAQRWLARWEKLSDEERRAEEEGKPWALADWLHWMEPERRSWWWWGSDMGDELQVLVQVDEWPFPWGGLAWLLRAAGARDVLPEE